MLLSDTRVQSLARIQYSDRCLKREDPVKLSNNLTQSRSLNGLARLSTVRTCTVRSPDRPVGRIIDERIINRQRGRAVVGFVGSQVAKVLVDWDPVLEPGDLRSRNSGNFGVQSALCALFKNGIL